MRAVLSQRTLGALIRGRAIRIALVATSALGTLLLASSAYAWPPVPENTSAPTITGAAQQGQTLTEAHGAWSNSPTGYSYQWQRCSATGTGCTAISGATSQTYVPLA